MHAWTTASLAARVGCSEATVFKHFRSKDEILTEALRHQAEALRRHVAEYRGQGSGVQKAAGLILHVLETVEGAGGAPLVILLGQATRLQAGMQAQVEKTMGLLRSRLEGYLAEGGGDGGVGEADRTVVAEMLIAVGHSSALRWLAFGRRGSPVAIARPMLRLLTRCATTEETLA